MEPHCSVNSFFDDKGIGCVVWHGWKPLTDNAQPELSQSRCAHDEVCDFIPFFHTFANTPVKPDGTMMTQSSYSNNRTKVQLSACSVISHRGGADEGPCGPFVEGSCRYFSLPNMNLFHDVDITDMDMNMNMDMTPIAAKYSLCEANDAYLRQSSAIETSCDAKRDEQLLKKLISAAATCEDIQDEADPKYTVERPTLSPNKMLADHLRRRKSYVYLILFVLALIAVKCSLCEASNAYLRQSSAIEMSCDAKRDEQLLKKTFISAAATCEDIQDEADPRYTVERPTLSPNKMLADHLRRRKSADSRSSASGSVKE